MRGLAPLLDLWRPVAAKAVRAYLSTLNPLAPSDMHMRGARWLAALEVRQ